VACEDHDYLFGDSDFLVDSVLAYIQSFSRKGAKRYRVSKGFLCAFAPLREKYFFDPIHHNIT
jgi:hypothetical protein